MRTIITRLSHAAGESVAPASDVKPRGQKRAGGHRRVQITLTIPWEMMNRLEAPAEQSGQTRARLLLLGAARVLRDGL